MLPLCSRCGLSPREYEYNPWCKACLQASGKLDYQRHRLQRLAAAKRRREELKTLVFDVYGGAACKCCGETQRAFLCIDHIHGGGLKHLKSIGRKAGAGSFYNWLKKNNFPSGFQVLCFNCNMAKHTQGKCPHQT